MNSEHAGSHVGVASRAAYRVFCSQNARSGYPGRCVHAGLHGKPCRLGVPVTSSPGISRHECRGNSTHCPAWGNPRERALDAIGRVTSWLHGSAIGGDVGIVQRDERASHKPPPWQCKRKKKRASLQVHGPRQDVASIPDWAKEALVSGKG